MDTTILTVVNKIGEFLNFAKAQYQRLSEVDSQVRDLRLKLEFLMVWIQVAEERNIMSRDNLVDVWVRQIRGAVFSSEDIVEEYCHEVFTSRPGYETEARRRRPCIPCLCFPVKEGPVRYDLAQRIEDIINQLDTIQKNSLADIPNRVDNENIGRILDKPSVFSSVPRNRLDHHGSKRRPTRRMHEQFGKRFENVALHGYMMSLTKTLIKDNLMQRAIVIVTGESGIGKTTLAKEFLTAEVTWRHFDICAWVCMPSETRFEKYLDQIYQQATEQIQHNGRRREDIKQILARRKYLVVLDGIDSMAQLKSILREIPDGAIGSGILVTTQLQCEEVRHSIPDIMQIVEMKCLERDDCINLFDQWVDTGHLQGQDLGMFFDKVYAISRGLPLAVVLLGGLLYCKDHVRQWDEVFKLLESYEHMRRIKRILTVSYATMPMVVKLCFLYLAALPQNVQLDVDKLITLWCSEGIFESQDRNGRTDEKLAQQCYFVLILRGLIQPGTAIFMPTINECVHNFAKKIAQETSFFEQSDNFDIRDASVVRRLSVHNYFDRHVLMDSYFPKMRTLLGGFVEDCAEDVTNPQHGPSVRSQAKSFKVSSFLLTRKSKACKQSRLEFLRHSKFLRVLDLQGVRLGRLPDSIGDMIHLRYLGLRGCGLKDVSPSVAKLMNLETLDITDNEVDAIVEEFWRIDGLKHVLAQKLLLPGSMGFLRKLITLHGVIPSSDWTQHNCPLREMKSLLSLEMLGITDISGKAIAMALDEHHSRLYHLRLAGDVIHPSIVSCKFRSLLSLELYGRILFEKVSYNSSRSFLPPCLERLVLISSCMSQELVDNLFTKETAIYELQLLDNSFTESTLLFQKNALPFLTKLKIGNMNRLEKLVIGEDSMRELGNLEIFGCPEMKTIRGLKTLKYLSRVILYEMPAVVAQIEADEKEVYGRIKHVRTVA